MNYFLSTFLISQIFFWLASGNIFAQEKQENKVESSGKTPVSFKEIDTHPVIGSVNATRENVMIEYSVPFQGVCEFKIFSPDSHKVYHQQYKTIKGANHINIKAQKLKSGKHTFTILYKGHKIESEFNIP